MFMGLLDLDFCSRYKEWALKCGMMSLITELITTKLQTFYQGLIRSMRWSHISGARVTENCNKFANLLTHFCLKFLATVCH